MGVRCWARHGPASRPGVIWMTLFPVSASPLKNCPLDGGGAAEFGEERAVEVDAAEAGGGEGFGF